MTEAHQQFEAFISTQPTMQAASTFAGSEASPSMPEPGRTILRRPHPHSTHSSPLPATSANAIPLGPRGPPGNVFANTYGNAARRAAAMSSHVRPPRLVPGAGSSFYSMQVRTIPQQRTSGVQNLPQPQFSSHYRSSLASRRSDPLESKVEGRQGSGQVE